MATPIYLDGGHIILVEKGWWHTRYYFDSLPMYYCGEQKQGRKGTIYRFAAVTREDLHKVTYSLVFTPGFLDIGGSIRVEKYEGDSMMQWHDEIGEIVYSSK